MPFASVVAHVCYAPTIVTCCITWSTYASQPIAALSHSGPPTAAALNPTYNFGEYKDEMNNQLGPLPTSVDGRRHSVSAPVSHQPPKLTSTGSMVRSQSGRVPSGRTWSGRPASAGVNHGHKGG
jgi:hypothetical protein